MDCEKRGEIYHERQKWQFCLLHALNNLFQAEVFTRASLDGIAHKLVVDDPNKQTWTPLTMIFKPHHNALTGNYDINVLIEALREKGKTVVWHDRRNRASTIDLDAPEDKLFGVVLNVKTVRYAGLWKSRHWVALRKIRGVWYNLDSDFAFPESFENSRKLEEFLDWIVANDGEILIVMNKND